MADTTTHLHRRVYALRRVSSVPLLVVGSAVALTAILNSSSLPFGGRVFGSVALILAAIALWLSLRIVSARKGIGMGRERIGVVALVACAAATFLLVPLLLLVFLLVRGGLPRRAAIAGALVCRDGSKKTYDARATWKTPSANCEVSRTANNLRKSRPRSTVRRSPKNDTGPGYEPNELAAATAKTRRAGWFRGSLRSRLNQQLVEVRGRSAAEPRNHCGMLAYVKRTTLKIPDDLDAQLRHEASLRGVTISEVSREALEAYLGDGLPDRRRRLAAAGTGRSGRADISERIEEILAAEVGR